MLPGLFHKGNDMATLPSLEEAARAILDVFGRHGTRPGEGIMQQSLMPLMEGRNPFRADDLNKALQSMETKGWVEIKREGFITLTEAGYSQV